MTFFVLINNTLESQCLGSILNITTRGGVFGKIIVNDVVYDR
jgi:hypothetical protein